MNLIGNDLNIFLTNFSFVMGSPIEELSLEIFCNLALNSPIFSVSAMQSVSSWVVRFCNLKTRTLQVTSKVVSWIFHVSLAISHVDIRWKDSKPTAANMVCKTFKLTLLMLRILTMQTPQVYGSRVAQWRVRVSYSQGLR